MNSASDSIFGPTSIKWTTKGPIASPNLDLVYDIKKEQAKYQLEGQEKETLEEAINYLKESDLTQNNLYLLFESWESNKTKGIKKFLITITLLLTISFFGNININDIGLLGIDTKDSVQIVLIPVILLIVVMSFTYFEFSRDNDKSVSLSKINSIINELKYCKYYAEFIDRLIVKYKCQDFIDLYKDNSIGKIKPATKNAETPLPTYHAFKHYSSNLEKPFLRNTFLNKMELRTIYLLGFISFFTLVRSFLSELNPELNLTSFHLVSTILIFNLLLAFELRFEE